MRLLSMKIADYVDKMSTLWVEGQVVQVSRRPGVSTAYLVLRDADVDMSLSVTVRVTTLDAMASPLSQGARVVVQAKPEFWTKRGTLHLDARQVRPIGIGELLARLEHLKRLLASEGLFDADRKRALPFLPGAVGLICGRGSAAEKDVVQNAVRRWPAVRFEVRQVSVQGPNTVVVVVEALADLDRNPAVDVIVVSRGGGSFEDLLPFSNEGMLRAVAACRTPVVSAIGHDVDTPLLDFVADVRASTPSDAAKRVVPDVAEQRAEIAAWGERVRRTVGSRVRAERRALTALRSRPVLADPMSLVTVRRRDVEGLRDRAGRRFLAQIHRGSDQISHLRAQVQALSPLSTLQRGYAVVQHQDGRIVDDQADVEPDELLRVRVARGDFGVRVVGG